MDPTTHHRDLPASFVDAIGTTQPLGMRGEALAAHHLVADDQLTLVERNWRLASGELRGELDLVAHDPRADVLVICEVKTRRDADRFGGAVATVDHRKHARLRALTGAYLRQCGQSYDGVRLDLLAIDLGRSPRLTHLVGAL